MVQCHLVRLTKKVNNKKIIKFIHGWGDYNEIVLPAIKDELKKSGESVDDWKIYKTKTL